MKILYNKNDVLVFNSFLTTEEKKEFNKMVFELKRKSNERNKIYKKNYREKLKKEGFIK